jgi:flagellar biosynthesis protein FlhA
VAGLIIGVMQHDLDLATAAETYTILTVGEGLVTAIPALLVSMAGGLITTRAASESHLGEEVATQLFARPKPLAIAGGVLTFLALIPGLPKVAFLSVATVLFAAAYAVRELPADASDADAPLASPDMPEQATGVDPISIEVGYALVSLVDENQGGTLLTRVRAIRRQIAQETGVVVAAVRIADNLQLGPRGYNILIKGVEVARGELYAERLLAINPGTATDRLDGVHTQEAAFGLPATWIANEMRDAATSAGYTVVDATTALSTHLSETIRSFLPDLLSRQQVKEMLDQVAQSSPKLIDELVPKVVSVGEVQRVLRQLLRERVPVRDLVTILEALADAAAVTKDADAMTESVRSAIGRAICRPYQNDKGELTVIGVQPALEEKLLGQLVKTEQGAVLALDPQQAQSIATRIARAVEQAMAQPVLLCSPALRPHLWRLFARVLPHLGVISHAEVPAHIQVVPVATLD